MSLIKIKRCNLFRLCEDCTNNVASFNKTQRWCSYYAESLYYEAGSLIPVKDFKELDNINHPPHYTMGKIEVIDAIEDWKLDFHRANAVKYITRSPFKGAEIEDLKKAVFYLNRLIKLKEAK